MLFDAVLPILPRRDQAYFILSPEINIDTPTHNALQLGLKHIHTRSLAAAMPLMRTALENEARRLRNLVGWAWLHRGESMRPAPDLYHPTDRAP